MIKPRDKLKLNNTSDTQIQLKIQETMTLGSPEFVRDDSIVADEAKPSKVREVLSQGRRDIWASQPIFFEFFFSPIRDFVLDPTLAVSAILLPPLLGERTDTIAAAIFRVMLAPARVVYNRKITNDDEDGARSAARNAIMHAGTTHRTPKYQPPSDVRSAFVGAVAFTCSAIADVVSAVMNPKKMKKWFEAMTQLKAFLDASGVGDELDEALMKPMLRGRLLDNMKILNDIQEKNDADRCEKARSRDVGDIDEEVKEGQRLMRFATAAYGTEMIRSAIDREVDPEDLRDEKKAIACHTEISTKDVRLLYVQDSNDSHVLHHFVAIDRQSKSIVLALRGTLSISGAIVDIQAMECDFCTGKAHKGIAEMAETLWEVSGKQITDLFKQEEFKKYGFIITGHSLGAGTACLLNVKCHVERLVGDRPVRCYAFAPPPTFYLCESLERDNICTNCIQRAVQNTVAYIHDNDAVPFLSVASVRRLANLLDAVDNKTEHIWFWRRWKIFHEWADIPQDLFESVVTAGNTKSRAVEGECEMTIPARVVIWVKKNPLNGKFEAFGCDPKAVGSGTVFLCQDMLTDHLPEQYEDALDAIVG